MTNTSVVGFMGSACSFHLFATVDAVLAEDRSAACGHPHSSQRVAVNLVLLNHPLAFLVLEHGARCSRQTLGSFSSRCLKV